MVKRLLIAFGAALALALAAVAQAPFLAHRRTASRPPPADAAYDYAATDLDGTSDYLSLPGDMAVVTDAKTFTFSCWVLFEGGDATDMNFINISASAGLNRFWIQKTTANKIRVVGRNAAGATILDLLSDSTLTAASGWTHLYVCIDLVDIAKRKIYFNGSSISLTVSTYINDTIDFTAGVGGGNNIGALVSAAWKLNGCLSEVWWTNTYLDDTTKFASGGKPISLGADGSLPTGTQPIIYLKDSSATFENNSGSGGDFTINGAFTACGTEP